MPIGFVVTTRVSGTASLAPVHYNCCLGGDQTRLVLDSRQPRQLARLRLENERLTLRNRRLKLFARRRSEEVCRLLVVAWHARVLPLQDDGCLDRVPLLGDRRAITTRNHIDAFLARSKIEHSFGSNIIFRL